ncbi:hypothetical protein [Pseudoalteromonas sp. MTN2-4]|uniref:hypothetical protein n=1 Tax=Pseudoalteromonas sp. MTN2-4 TaxID=3056555 RepID=UPI0036F350EC
MEVMIEVRQKSVSIKQIIMVVVSIICMALTAYITSLFMADFDRFNLQANEKLAFVIGCTLALPLASLIISQLLIEYRGLKNAIKAVFYSSILVLAAQTPIVFQLISKV